MSERLNANIAALERIKRKQVLFVAKIDAIFFLVQDFAPHRREVHSKISAGITHAPASAL